MAFCFRHSLTCNFDLFDCVIRPTPHNICLKKIHREFVYVNCQQLSLRSQIVELISNNREDAALIPSIESLLAWVCRNLVTVNMYYLKCKKYQFVLAVTGTASASSIPQGALAIAAICGSSSIFIVVLIILSITIIAIQRRKKS